MRASADENPDLYWAIRGGGGNFGVVTSFLFRANPVGTVVAGPTFWPIEQSEEVLRAYREFLPAAPRELNGFFAFHFVPPGPPFPEELWTRHVCGVVWNYLGTEEDLDKLLAPMLAVGTPIMHGVQLDALRGAQRRLRRPLSARRPVVLAGRLRQGDPGRGRRAPRRVGPEAADAASRPCTCTRSTAPPTTSGATDTPWGYRDARWGCVMVGVDPDPAQKDVITQWSKDYWEALHPHSAGGAYVNMMMDEGQDRREGELPRQLRAARRDQGKVRPGERLLRQPEHPSRGLK